MLPRAQRRTVRRAEAVPQSPAPAHVGRRALLWALGSAVVYLLVVGSFRFDFKQTDYPHHLLMADALLHGQLHIRPEALAWKQAELERTAAVRLDRYLRRTGANMTPAQREQAIRQRTEEAVHSLG